MGKCEGSEKVVNVTSGKKREGERIKSSEKG